MDFFETVKNIRLIVESNQSSRFPEAKFCQFKELNLEN